MTVDECKVGAQVYYFLRPGEYLHVQIMRVGDPHTTIRPIRPGGKLGLHRVTHPRYLTTEVPPEGKIRNIYGEG